MFKYCREEHLAPNQFTSMYNSRILLKLKLLENFWFSTLLLVCCPNAHCKTLPQVGNQTEILARQEKQMHKSLHCWYFSLTLPGAMAASMVSGENTNI